MKRVEQQFGRLLWASRLMILVAVVASVLVALAVLYMATVDVVHLLGLVAHYADPRLSQTQAAAMNAHIITAIVKAVDGYLMTAIMLIFALGLYELFVGKIEAAERSEVASRLLLIRDLDDLKDRLAKVVVLILVITFFQYSLQMQFQTTRDLLYLALGTLLVGGALFLSHQKDAKNHESHTPPALPRHDGRDADPLRHPGEA